MFGLKEFSSYRSALIDDGPQMSPHAQKLETQGEVVALLPALRAFARTFCKRPEDADDLVQETLLRALSSLDSYRPGTRLKSWLFTIMRNQFCTSALKSRRETIGIAPEISNSLTTPATQEVGVQMMEVRSAMHRLPPQQREVLMLIVVLGETYEDAAQICGCAVGTVKIRLNRARQQLCQDIGGD